MAGQAQFGQSVLSRHDLSTSETELLAGRISLHGTMLGLNTAWADLVLGRGENPIEALSVKE